jgi:hypothetical protein
MYVGEFELPLDMRTYSRLCVIIERNWVHTCLVKTCSGQKLYRRMKHTFNIRHIFTENK